MTKLSSSLTDKIKLADEYICGCFKEDNPVYNAMNYSLCAGGKRLRPLLCILAAEALGAKAEDALPFAAAIEMVHTYSLIHDDLPAMDNDDLRRGKPTNHKVFGEASAILAGDALLTEAFGVIAKCGAAPERKAAAVLKLSECAGARGMVLGQELDIKGADSLSDVLSVYEKKTSCLLSAALGMGAAAAGGNGNEFDVFANNLGIAFQIKDDILDVTSSEEELGKPIKSDEKNEKHTSLSFMSIDEAQETVSKLTREAIASLDFVGKRGDELKEVALYLIERKK